MGCWFPHDDQPDKPGGKFRPCFVMGVNNQFGSELKLCLAYGTGQRTDDKSKTVVRDWEFELDAGEGGNKLTEQTRFDCFKHVWLPYTTEWFYYNSQFVSAYGSAPKNRVEEIRLATEKGRAKVNAAAAKSKSATKAAHVSKSSTSAAPKSHKPDNNSSS